MTTHAAEETGKAVAGSLWRTIPSTTPGAERGGASELGVMSL
jgi:hypothetical protein